MYYKPKALITFVVLSTITHHLNCGPLSAKEEPEGNAIYNDLNNLESGLSTYSHNENAPLVRSFNKRASDMDAGFQADTPGEDYYSSQLGSNSHALEPTVQCFGNVMTLTAHGREYTHILVDRAGVSPLYLFQLPSYCGYNVKVTWRDLVLMAPFDGCYITRENSSYVLSLLWWGRPIKIACPMTHSSQPSPSVFCSQFGMIIRIVGAREPAEKLRVKVNGEVLPVLSETCAYRVNSPSDVVILHTAFSSKCVTLKDGENRLVIIVDGKQFALSCPFPHHLSPLHPYLHSQPFHQLPNLKRKPFIPHVPGSLQIMGTMRHPTTPPEPETSKSPEVPHVSYEPPFVPQFYTDSVQQPLTSDNDTYPIHPPNIYQHLKPTRVSQDDADWSSQDDADWSSQDDADWSSQDDADWSSQDDADWSSQDDADWSSQDDADWSSQDDADWSSQDDADWSSPSILPPISYGTTEEEQVPQEFNPVTLPVHYTPYPIHCPPYPEEFCFQYPEHDHQYDQTLSPALETTIQPMPEIIVSRQPTYMPLTTPDMQTALLPQIPISPPVPTEQPPKVTSPSLGCTRNRITATLPYAKMDSIKVKETKTNSWMSIASVPVSCNYTLRSRGDAVVLSSPLPACHTQTLSSSVTSLFVRFWDSSQMRTRSIQLQCQHTLPPDVLKPVHHIMPPNTSTPAPSQQPPDVQVLCSSQHMSVKMLSVPMSSLVVEAPSSGNKTQIKAMPLLGAPSHCGYSLKRAKDSALKVLLPYSSCHMIQQDGQHKIILKYQMPDGHTVKTLLSCQASDSQECNVVIDQQLLCGSGALSSTECHDKGCCYSLDTQLCYYPMDECTADQHFVFLVNSSMANPPLSLSTLVTSGNSSCSPEKVTADFALFKIPLDKCGVHRYEVGKTVIYMVEILNQVQSVSLNYGTITRDSPVRLLVECRYNPGSVVSVGYLVKSPSLGPAIKAQGVFGVQLRIAKDEHYNDFYPQYHQPLRMLLGKPLYLEVRLINPPDPTTMLLVHYCVAYPRSARSAWILIYDGCPNTLDQTPTHTPPATPAEALTNHVRRFTVTTFKFLPEDDGSQADEEIYFMCSTEVCLPSDGPCIEGCFGDPANVTS